MSDLVERLRERKFNVVDMTPLDNKLEQEAADRIEELEGVLAEIAQPCPGSDCTDCAIAQEQATAALEKGDD